MAILHVRNVPDALHERIKKCADAEKRSLSAEVLMLLQQALDQGRQGAGPRQQSVAEILEEMRRDRENRVWDGVDTDEALVRRFTSTSYEVVWLGDQSVALM